MTGVWPLVTGLPTGSPGTLDKVSPLWEAVASPLDSTFFITAAVTLFSPSGPFLPSDSLIALNPPQIPLDILTSPFSKVPLEEEEEEEQEDFLLLKDAADSPESEAGAACVVMRAPFWAHLDASFGEELFGSADRSAGSLLFTASEHSDGFSDFVTNFALFPVAFSSLEGNSLFGLFSSSRFPALL